MQISKLESQIKSLENEMENATSAIDNQIDKLSEYKEKIQDVADEYENAENIKYALAVTGLNSESEILQCRADVLNTFRNNYISIQQSIADAAWASANSQIAALNAVKAAEATNEQTSGGSSASVGNSNNDTPPIKSTPITKPSSQKSTVVKGNHTAPIKGVGNTMQRYGTGTKDAEPGVHTVAENGAEIIRDNYGNAYVAEGEQLHYFEGGETVIKASESAKILANMDNLIPLQDYVGKLSPIDYSSMVMSNLNIPDFSKLAVNRGESTTISIGDIHLHEVQNVPDFAKALQKHLPNISVQYNGRH